MFSGVACAGAGKIALYADSWEAKGSVFGACGALAGTPPCVLARTSAEADAQGTWFLPVLISGTLAIVCASPDV